MYAVFLAFSKGHPDPEDEAIKAYLDAHEPIPKAQGSDTFDDQEFDVLYFGGCYLGKHLDVIGDMQRQAVEHQLLTVAIERILQDMTAPETRKGGEEHLPDAGPHRHPGPRGSTGPLLFGANEAGYPEGVPLEPAVIEQRGSWHWGAWRLGPVPLPRRCGP